MDDILGLAALVGVPIAIFMYTSWRREQRDRERQRKGEFKTDTSRETRSHWGGMGRPGR